MTSEPAPPTWWSFYAADGLLQSTWSYCQQSDLQHCTPAGCTAIAGRLDAQRYKVDTSTGAVVSWQPPKPPDDVHRTWVWDEGSWQWVEQPTLAALIATRIAPVDAAMAEAEAAQARPQGDILVAMLAGQIPAPADVAMLTTLRTQVATARAVRAAMSAAATPEALAAISWP